MKCSLTVSESALTIPLSDAGDPHPLAKLAPGIFGYAILGLDGSLYVPFIMSEQEGSGVVGKWLDALPTDRRVVFPIVLSGRLAGMLERRGFHVEIDYYPDPWVLVNCWVREAPPSGRKRRR